MCDTTTSSDVLSSVIDSKSEQTLNPQAPCFDASSEWARLFDDAYQSFQTFESPELPEQKIQRLEKYVIIRDYEQ